MCFLFLYLFLGVNPVYMRTRRACTRMLWHNIKTNNTFLIRRILACTTWIAYLKMPLTHNMVNTLGFAHNTTILDPAEEAGRGGLFVMSVSRWWMRRTRPALAYWKLWFMSEESRCFRMATASCFVKNWSHCCRIDMFSCYLCVTPPTNRFLIVVFRCGWNNEGQSSVYPVALFNKLVANRCEVNKRSLLPILLLYN